MWLKLKTLVDNKLIRPLRESHAPARELALATAIGVFWGLNPLIGLQMGLVAMTWVLVRPLKIRFHLGVGAAWVWITNPVTTPPLFYAFYLCGLFLFPRSGGETLDFAGFQAVITKAGDLGFLDGLLYWLRFMVFELGRPLLLGSIAIAVPSALISFPITLRFLNAYRRRKAAKEGLTLDAWEQIYVYRRVKKPTVIPGPGGHE